MILRSLLIVATPYRGFGRRVFVHYIFIYRSYYICTYLCVFTYYICMYTSIHIYIHMHIYIYLYTNVCIIAVALGQNKATLQLSTIRLHLPRCFSLIINECIHGSLRSY